jgi:predicted MPP superfamily phosphohydrolase
VSAAVNAIARLIFVNFWSFIALGAAVSQWGLWCWFGGVSAPPALHLAAIAALTAAHRLAALALEQERHRRPVARALGMGWLAAGFGAFVVAGSVGALAIAWTVLNELFAGPASAGGAGSLPLAAPEFRMLGTAGAAAAAAVMLHGYVRGHRRLHVERRTLAFADLPAGLDGLRIAHLSDLHVGPLADRAALERAIDTANALDADLACVTGDVVDSDKTDLDAWMPLLARLRARRGVLAILGNHDRDAGLERVAGALERGTPWRLLRDDVATLAVGGATLQVAGLDDRRPPHVTSRLPDLLARLERDAFVVLLCHHPDGFDDAAAAGIPLTLAGHTHGGQLAVPGMPQLNVARLLISRRSIGWYRMDGQYMHVSAGLGVSGQRVRVGVPSEITEITLVRAPDDGSPLQ